MTFKLFRNKFIMCIKYLFPCLRSRKFNEEDIPGTELRDVDQYNIDLDDEFIIYILVIITFVILVAWNIKEIVNPSEEEVTPSYFSPRFNSI